MPGFVATAKEQSLVLVVARPAPEGSTAALAGSEVYFLPAGQRTSVVTEIGAECVAFVAPVPTTRRAVDRAEQVTDAAANPSRRAPSLMAELGASHCLRAAFPWKVGAIYPGATIELEVELQSPPLASGALMVPEPEPEADGDQGSAAGGEPAGEVDAVPEPALATEKLQGAGVFGVAIPPSDSGLGKMRRGKREE